MLAISEVLSQRKPSATTNIFPGVEGSGSDGDGGGLRVEVGEEQEEERRRSREVVGTGVSGGWEGARECDEMKPWAGWRLAGF